MSEVEATLLGRMTQAGERVLGTLALSAAFLGGSGALAVGSRNLWLAQPQLIGGPAVACVPLADVGAVSSRSSRRRRGATVLELQLAGRTVEFSTRAGADDVEQFLRTLRAAVTPGRES
ncbi:hypothetical protein [Kineococcus sp. SYSU DK003]|uniref:hypothetical protein n=1 Tax=Kineococcus sp. SYSU DK003 TaxID=3383124 RepID=UPI003D7D9EFE